MKPETLTRILSLRAYAYEMTQQAEHAPTYERSDELHAEAVYALAAAARLERQ